MSEQEDTNQSVNTPTPPPSTAETSSAQDDTPPPPPLPAPPAFDPSRMIGIIKRKALIKELASVYHQECLAHCQELLELQKKTEEPFYEVKIPDDFRKETTRPSKRAKKTR
ncbi:uncharacterized protein [Rutidosis leptorrhynchoides]|uniref:uncharacterized protein n=1 Tax=Rutidosis leptorrhynchoides TaxID=125765 RepID=UPI003A99DBAD